MTGIHCCYRRLLFLNNSRLTGRNGVLLQLTRKRHQLVFQISSLQNRAAFQKPKLLYNTNKLLLYRLASTSITDSKEPISVGNLKDSKVSSDSSRLNTESTNLNTEPSQSGNQPEVLASSDGNIINENLLPPIPTEIPEAPVLKFISTDLGEPSLQSLGLGSWWPSGLVQQLLEYLHVNLGLPWWESILVFTIIIRCFLVPLNIKVRRDSAVMINKHMPVMNKLQEKIQEARMRGDHYTVAVHGKELQDYITQNKVSLFGSFRIMLVQTPVFLSTYYALSGMTSAPVESLKTGGLFWFQDLTEPDPYYILPVILSTSLLLVFETGAEGNVNALNNPASRWIFRGISGVIFLISLKFASCLTWYWTISNSLSLLLVATFKLPVVKNLLKLPDVNRTIKPIKSKKGFIKGLKEGIENAKITRELQDRERMNQIAFEKAGQGPVLRTFKKSPVLQKDKKSS